MTLYYVIQPGDGPVTSEEWDGETEFGCPKFEEIRKALWFKEHTLLEHVSVLWKGKHAHMFVHEEGLLEGLQTNRRATRIYWNNSIRRMFRHDLYLYTDLAKSPMIPASIPNTDRAKLMSLIEARIVGPAFLWEGEME